MTQLPTPAPKIERWLVYGDLQIPYQDSTTWAVLNQYVADHRWDGIINLGDYIDYEGISRWVADAPRKYMHSRIKLSLEVARSLLERQVDLVRYGKNGNPNCKYIYIEGNHENRIEQFLDTFPQFEGMLEVEKTLDLFNLGIQWVPFWTDPRKVFRKGKASFIHGNYINQYHAAKHVRQYGTNVFYGHTHTVQEHSLLLGGNTTAITGKSLGCLCDPSKMEYIRGKPTDWVQAFSTFFFLPNGNFTEYTTKIFNHTFVSPDGKLYQP